MALKPMAQCVMIDGMSWKPGWCVHSWDSPAKVGLWLHLFQGNATFYMLSLSLSLRYSIS